MVLLEKSSLPRRGGDQRCFSSGPRLAVAPRSPNCVPVHTLSPGHPGAAPQLLPPHSPGFQAGCGAMTPLLSGISYFHSLYLYHGSCSMRLLDANTGKLPFLLHPPAVLLTPGKVAVGGDQTCQALRPLP